jgi:hypothetical protein
VARFRKNCRHFGSARLFEALWDAAIFHESLPGFDRVTPAELALNDLVIGHFMYQHVSKLRSARFLMTFLRDPIDRVVSNYHFLRTRSRLCDDRNVLMITANFQTKALAHKIRPDVLDETMTSALLENAERNLGTFDFIGICEYFDDSVRVLSEMLGVELSAKKLNVNPDRRFAASTAEELDIARSLNRLDIQLYDKARSRFERIHLSRSAPGSLRSPAADALGGSV